MPSKRLKNALLWTFFPFIFLGLILSTTASLAAPDNTKETPKNLAYLVSDIDIPFWKVMGQGIVQKAQELGYNIEILSAQNKAKQELKNTVLAINKKYDGVILSPTSSSAAATVLRLFNKNNIPVVIADIGADGGHYVSYISSDNYSGAFNLAQTLTQKLKKKNQAQGQIGIIAIPQKRENGRQRTKGFIDALPKDKFGPANIKQQKTFSYKETYDYTVELIQEHPSMNTIWIQGSNQYQAALDAIKTSKTHQNIYLICFDIEPDFLNLIPQDIILAAAMQQPYLMGQEATVALDKHLHQLKTDKHMQLPVLIITKENIEQHMKIIKQNVLSSSDQND